MPQQCEIDKAKKCFGPGWNYDPTKDEYWKSLPCHAKVYAKPTREHKDYSLVVVYGPNYENKRMKIRDAAENPKTLCPNGLQLDVPDPKWVVNGDSAVWCRFRLPYRTEAEWYAGCQQVANAIQVFLDWLSEAVA